MKKKRRFVIPACVLVGVALLCLGVWGLMEYFGSPLIPGSLERRYAREVAAHRQELLDFSQQCLETGAVPEGGSLPGFVRDVQVSGREAESLFVEFDCDGWGLVPSSSYYGFYYSPEGPRAFQEVEVELTPEEDGYSWQAEGDNRGFTREIGEGFYYYEAHF